MYKPEKNTETIVSPTQTTHFGTDLEERCYRFARDYGLFCKSIKKDFVTLEYCIQGTRSSGSVGANYIEANEAISKKDFALRVKIARKETKESRLWLRLCQVSENGALQGEQQALIAETVELAKILSSILEKAK